MLIGMGPPVERFAGILLEGAAALGDHRGVRSRARAVLATACSIHFVHDGFSDILYVLLPLWANDFRLTFAQVGMIRTAYSGGMAAFTAITALGFIAVGAVGEFLALLSVLLVAGIGSGVQHPLSSSLVSKAYETGPRRAALGTYNFSGDVGKVAVPAAVAFAALAGGWRAASMAYGAIGLVAAASILGVLARLGVDVPRAAADARPEEPAAVRSTWGSGWGIRDLRGFQALTAIGMIDNATRTGFLTFL